MWGREKTTLSLRLDAQTRGAKKVRVRGADQSQVRQVHKAALSVRPDGDENFNGL